MAAGAAFGVVSGDEATIPQRPTPLISLTYVGPIVMSFGCFALIFAFVVFCETRDRAIEHYIRCKLYSTSSRGPRHCRLPFRQNVVDLMLMTTRRRAERTVKRLSTPDTLSRHEAAAGSQRTDDDDCVSVDRRASLLPGRVDDSYDRDRLLSNGMLISASQTPPPSPANDLLTLHHDQSSERLLRDGMLHTESVVSFHLDRSNPYHFRRNQLDFEQPRISRSWLSSPISLDWPNAGFEQSRTNRYSKRSLVDKMLHTESSHDPHTSEAAAGRNDQQWLTGVSVKHLDLREGGTPLDRTMLAEALPDRGCRIATVEMSDETSESIQDALSICDADWTAELKSAESVPLMLAEDSDTTPESAKPETASMNDAEQPEVVSMSLSSSATSLMFGFLFCEDGMMTAATNNDRTEDHAVMTGSSPASPETVSNGSDKDDTPGASADSDDGRRPTSAYQSPPEEHQTPLLSEAGQVSDGRNRGEVKRLHQDTERRSRAGIHCPPPLPPPPTSPTVAAKSGRRQR